MDPYLKEILLTEGREVDGDIVTIELDLPLGGEVFSSGGWIISIYPHGEIEVTPPEGGDWEGVVMDDDAPWDIDHARIWGVRAWVLVEDPEGGGPALAIRREAPERLLVAKLV